LSLKVWSGDRVTAWSCVFEKLFVIVDLMQATTGGLSVAMGMQVLAPYNRM
jgi:hypothetical protein